MINYFRKNLHQGFEYILVRMSEICVSQLFLIASFGIWFQTVPSQVALSSVFRLALKNCVVYSITCIYVSVFFYKFLLCMFMLHFIRSFSKKKIIIIIKIKNKWSNYCLLMVRKSFFHILLERDDGKLLNKSLTRHGLKKAQNGWLCDTLESCSNPSLVHGKWNILFTNLYQELCPSLWVCF